MSLSEEMLYNLNQEEGVSEGGLIDLSSIQGDLLKKRRAEEYIEDDSKTFTMTFLECNDILLGTKPAWENIKGDLGYDVTSAIIETCSKSGDLYVDTSKNETKVDMVYNGTMIYTEIKMDINVTLDYCFPDCSLPTNENGRNGALSRARIKIPAAVLQSYSTNGSYSIGMGTMFDMANASMPSFFEDDEADLRDSSILLQTTVDFGLIGIEVKNLSEGNEIQISFKLDEDQVNTQ